MNSFDNMIEGAIITLILAIVGTILAYIFIIPEKKKEESKDENPIVKKLSETIKNLSGKKE